MKMSNVMDANEMGNALMALDNRMKEDPAGFVQSIADSRAMFS